MVRGKGDWDVEGFVREDRAESSMEMLSHRYSLEHLDERVVNSRSVKTYFLYIYGMQGSLM